MLSQKLNFHHSKLPQVGEVGYITDGTNRHNEILFYAGRKEKWQCIAYPLSDNVLPYSIGIHTAYFRNLATNQVKQFSGFYFSN